MLMPPTNPLWYSPVPAFSKLEDMTAEELEAKMKRIMEDYSPILEGVTEEEMKQKVKESKETTGKLPPLKNVTED